MSSVRRARLLQDVLGAGREVVGAVGDVVVLRAVLVGAAVALVVHGPGVEAARREPVHHRGIRPARHVEVEGRLRRHRRAVHEEDGAALRHARRRGLLVPQEELHVALLRPVLGAALSRSIVDPSAMRFSMRDIVPASASILRGCSRSFLLARALSLDARAHETRDMALVGAHGARRARAYQPVIQRQGARWIAYVGHHAGRAREPAHRRASRTTAPRSST